MVTAIATDQDVSGTSPQANSNLIPGIVGGSVAAGWILSVTFLILVLVFICLRKSGSGSFEGESILFG